jgi:hypothetical protein
MGLRCLKYRFEGQSDVDPSKPKVLDKHASPLYLRERV